MDWPPALFIKCYNRPAKVHCLILTGAKGLWLTSLHYRSFQFTACYFEFWMFSITKCGTIIELLSTQTVCSTVYMSQQQWTGICLNPIDHTHKWISQLSTMLEMLQARRAYQQPSYPTVHCSFNSVSRKRRKSWEILDRRRWQHNDLIEKSAGAETSQHHK